MNKLTKKNFFIAVKKQYKPYLNVKISDLSNYVAKFLLLCY